MYGEIRQLAETDSVREANQLLSLGWRLIEVYVAADRAWFVLGLPASADRDTSEAQS